LRDLAETRNLADEFPEVVEKIEPVMINAGQPSPVDDGNDGDQGARFFYIGVGRMWLIG
jgi:hypothetical protein